MPQCLFFILSTEFLQSTFRRAVDEEDENGFHVLFLVARQLTRYNESVFGDYATWWVSHLHVIVSVYYLSYLKCLK